PNIGQQPSAQSIISDLQALKRAGFTGIVTYGASGSLGTLIPGLAKQEGFDGLIIGVWNPGSQSEIATAVGWSNLPNLVGYCVGNEGLLDSTYTMPILASAIQQVRGATGKPVTTTEVIDSYLNNPTLLNCGDWVYPNAHPYYHNIKDPTAASQWTVNSYNSLRAQTNQVLIFKEVGLPTAGDPACSPAGQQQYYTLLKNSAAKFNYFEAFDQPWKTWTSVEPYWGVLQSDRAAKPLGQYLSNTYLPNMSFYIYQDAGYFANHYIPSGFIGDTGDLTINTASTQAYSGSTSCQITYSPKGTQGWAGIYWQDPVNNWGTNGSLIATGYDLSLYNSLQLYARSDNPCTVTFEVGGINNAFGDSQTTPVSVTSQLNQSWQLISIPLSGANLSHIIGGFCLSIAKSNNPSGANFYLDEIKFVANQTGSTPPPSPPPAPPAPPPPPAALIPVPGKPGQLVKWAKPPKPARPIKIRPVKVRPIKQARPAKPISERHAYKTY
ncbi:MAG: hypothetical protein C5B53_12060, partial [Candidatus Melainabacteria bacterium]